MLSRRISLSNLSQHARMVAAVTKTSHATAAPVSLIPTTMAVSSRSHSSVPGTPAQPAAPEPPLQPRKGNPTPVRQGKTKAFSKPAAPEPMMSEDTRRYILRPSSSAPTSKDTSAIETQASEEEERSRLKIDTEVRRLENQHFSYKRLCNGFTLHPELVQELKSKRETTKEMRLMDVGCGTGIWLRDLRKDNDFLPPKNVYHGADFDPSCSIAANEKLPEDERVLVLQQDVLQPFDGGGLPEECGKQGTYDLVTSRLLVFALETGIGWQKAVQNMADLLRPGGYLHLADLSAVVHPYRPDASHLDNSTSPYPEPIQTCNDIFEPVMAWLKRDQLAGHHIEDHLRQVGLRGVKSKTFRLPFGRAALEQHEQRSGRAPWTREEMDRHTETILGAISAARPALVAMGGVGSIKTGKDFDRWMQRFRETVHEQGMLVEFVMAFGQKK